MILVVRIVKEKLIGDLVEVFVEFYKFYFNFRFIIIGDGLDKLVLDKLIDFKKVFKYINILGFVKNVEVGFYY